MVPSTGIINGQCRVFAVWPNELTAKVSGIVYILLQFYIPLFLMIYAYVMIYAALRRRVNPANQGTVAERHREEKMARARGNVLKTLLTCCVFFFLCWVCNETLITLPHFGIGGNIFTTPFYAFTVYAVLFNAIVNPFIYAVKYQQFKISAKRLLFKARPEQSVYMDSAFTISTNVTLSEKPESNTGDHRETQK